MKIGIIGLGLIGGSLGRAIVSKTNNTVYAFDVNEKALKTGKLLNAYHEVLDEEKIKQLDLVFFSLYPENLQKALDDYAPLLKDGCLMVDCCGNKRRVVEQMKVLSEKFPRLEFISAHPMAGREFSGVSHSTINLFDKASMILVPVKADIRTVAMLKEFSLEVGFGSVVITTADKHDEIIAFTSQLAHLVSSAYIKSPRATQYMGFSAGSFRDMTRVAKLSSEMWSQLTMDNSDFLIEELNSFIDNLTQFKLALQNKDLPLMKALLEDGNERKILSEKLKKVKNND